MRRWQLVFAVLAAGLVAHRAEGDDNGYTWDGDHDSADLTCFVSGDRAAIQPFADGYNVTNATSGVEGQMFINLLLEDQYAQFELPGVLLRVRTDESFTIDFDDPLANLDDMKAGIWSTVGGNILGLFFCTIFTCVTLYLEKKFKCIGSEKIHEMIDKQQRLQGELQSAVEFIHLLDEDPTMEDLATKPALRRGLTEKLLVKAGDGALVSGVGATKATAVKKAAKTIAETDQYEQSKGKAQQMAEGSANKFANPLRADMSDSDDDDTDVHD